jgi:hypothetical protein
VIPDWLVPAALVAVVVLAVVATVTCQRDRSRTRAELAATRAESAELRAQIAALTRRLSGSDPAPEEFVITHVGEEVDAGSGTPDGGLPERLDGRLFADIVLRESVVKAAALTHGVRRALAPETRNRIRFEMRREVKRSRRQRRDTLRSIRREMAARQRAAEGVS